MRASTVDPRWNRDLGAVIYKVKVDGVNQGLFFTGEELDQLIENIHHARGARHDAKPQ